MSLTDLLLTNHARFTYQSTLSDPRQANTLFSSEQPYHGFECNALLIRWLYNKVVVLKKTDNRGKGTPVVVQRYCLRYETARPLMLQRVARLSLRPAGYYRALA